jgi:hypothetical protein
VREEGSKETRKRNNTKKLTNAFIKLSAVVATFRGVVRS